MNLQKPAQTYMNLRKLALIYMNLHELGQTFSINLLKPEKTFDFYNQISSTLYFCSILERNEKSREKKLHLYINYQAVSQIILNDLNGPSQMAQLARHRQTVVCVPQRTQRILTKFEYFSLCSMICKPLIICTPPD